MNSEKITQTDVTSRGITILTHFTKVENLPSILQQGLISRSELELNEHTFSHTDDLRLDGYTDGICLSISFPNYKMFYPSRIKDQSVKWAVIHLDASILWEKDCAFFPYNAASGDFYGISINSKKTKSAFLSLFAEQERIFTQGEDEKEINIREHANLHSFYPTNPQAEVICFDNIAPQYINEILFNDTAACQNVSLLTNTTCKIQTDVFFPRQDHHLW